MRVSSSEDLRQRLAEAVLLLIVVVVFTFPLAYFYRMPVVYVLVYMVAVLFGYGVGMFQVRRVPVVVSTVDVETGETEENVLSAELLPPADGCPICGAKHHPKLPHNRDSLYYQLAFEANLGRGPTWADAMAHCSESMKQQWRQMLIERSAWTAPSNGEEPVVDHGIYR